MLDEQEQILCNGKEVYQKETNGTKEVVDRSWARDEELEKETRKGGRK